MGVDIVFIIMVAYGFYFGYVYGLIKVVVFIISLILALGVSMYITPALSDLISLTIEIDSAFLPFVAFLVSVFGIMAIARIIFLLFDKNVTSKRVNQFTRAIGGFMMSGMFSFLFSVLVTFFSQAHVLTPEKLEHSSFFYPYVQKIPNVGTAVLERIAPYVGSFTKYMKKSLDQLREGGAYKEEGPRLDDLFIEEDYSLDSLKKAPPPPPPATDSTDLSTEED